MLLESSAENTQTLKDTTAQVMIRSSGLQGQIGTRDLTRPFIQAGHDCQPQSIISGKHQTTSPKVVRTGGEKDADYRKCLQEQSRTHETMETWDNVTSGPRKTK